MELSKKYSDPNSTMIFYDKLSDKELAVLLSNKDRSAFTEIYNRYKAVLFLHSLRMLKDDLEAEDLVHDLFSALWTRAEKYNTETPLNYYLYRSVKNRVLDVFAHKKVQNKHMESLQEIIESGSYITDNTIREKELGKLIEREITLLPKKMREIFEMSRNQNLSHAQIAAELNISDKTVKKQINNAIKILRNRLDLYVFFNFFL